MTFNILPNVQFKRLSSETFLMSHRQEVETFDTNINNGRIQFEFQSVKVYDFIILPP